jgi:hypothetical protein
MREFGIVSCNIEAEPASVHKVAGWQKKGGQSGEPSERFFFLNLCPSWQPKAFHSAIALLWSTIS